MAQFSELHDALSKPWIQLSSFTALVFLLTENCSGLPQVVGPSQPILATVGGDVVLSCRLEPAVDVSGMSILWSREDPHPSYVYMWDKGLTWEFLKHPDYKGRTSLLFSELKFGDVSLKLSKVKPSDEGKYRCFIPTLGRGSTVELFVGIDLFPVITLAGIDGKGGVELECKSAGWYPEPEVLWLDSDGNLLSAGPTKKIRGPDDLYTVSSRVTVEKKHGNNKLICRVQQKNINQTRETLIQVTDDFFEVQSSNTLSIVGLAVGLVVSVILLICCFVGAIEQDSKMKTLQEKYQNITIRHFDTNNQLHQETEERKKAENGVKILKNQLEKLMENNSETNNQLQYEKQKNEALNSRLEQLSETKRNFMEEKLKSMKTERKLKSVILNMNKELGETDSQHWQWRPTVWNQQEELAKQKWMKTVGNLKTELQKMNQELELTGPITLEEVSEQGSYIRLMNIFTEVIELKGWKLKLQINNREPAILIFDQSLKLETGAILCIRRPNCYSKHPDDVDLKWSEQKNWRPEDKLQIKLISNSGEIFKLM